MVDLSYVFLIFFITLGPLKTIPAFAMITAELPPNERRALAIKGALIATGIVLFVAFGAAALRRNWEISWASLAIATGVMLLQASLHVVFTAFAPGAPQPPPPTSSKGLLISPVVIPSIVTPYGVAAILLFLAGHPGDSHFRWGVTGMLLINMALNLVCMLIARPILNIVTVPGFRLVGWIFAILQAALAIEIIAAPLRRVFQL